MSSYSAVKRLSDSEEFGNALTHGLGFVGALVAWCYVLTTHQFGTDGRKLGFFVYGCSLLAVLLCSTLSHLIREPRALHRLRAWDQGTIYMLIAGTYTPGIIAYCDGWIEIASLCLIWSLALFGFYSKVFADHRVNAVTTFTYLLLGWLPAMVLLPNISSQFLSWLFAGGVCYSLGVLFLVNDRRVRFFHVVWHLMVMLAAGIHFYAICSMSL